MCVFVCVCVCACACACVCACACACACVCDALKFLLLTSVYHYPGVVISYTFFDTHRKFRRSTSSVQRHVNTTLWVT